MAISRSQNAVLNFWQSSLIFRSWQYFYCFDLLGIFCQYFTCVSNSEYFKNPISPFKMLVEPVFRGLVSSEPVTANSEKGLGKGKDSDCKLHMKFCHYKTGLLLSELRRRSWVCFQTKCQDQLCVRPREAQETVCYKGGSSHKISCHNRHRWQKGRR